jgi:hypothetical protein
MIYSGTQMPELYGKAIVVGFSFGNSYQGLLKCDLGNPPYYDTIVSKTVLVDWWYSYTTLMQGSDGFIYALCMGLNVLNRLRPNPGYVNNENTPVSFSLSQNYPNPFNPVTRIKYSIIKSDNVSLKIFDPLGVEIKTLVDEKKQPGSYEVEWNASNYPSGVYVYKLVTEDFTESKKMVLIK